MIDTKLPQNPHDSDESRFGDLIRDLRALPRIDAPPDFGMRLHARMETESPAPQASWLQSLLLWFRGSPVRIPVFALSAAGFVCIAVVGAVLFRSGVIDEDGAPASQGVGAIGGNGTPSNAQYSISPETADLPESREFRAHTPASKRIRRAERSVQPSEHAPAPKEEPAMDVQRGGQNENPAAQPSPVQNTKDDGVLHEGGALGAPGTGAADSLRARAAKRDSTRRIDSARSR